MEPTKEELAAQKEKEKEAQALAEATKAEKENEHMIPKSRLDEEITKRKELKGRLTAIEVANKKAEEQRLKDNEEYKTLAEKYQAEAETLKPKADIADKQEATLSALLTAQVEDLPENARSMVPEDYTTLQKLDWLATNRAQLMKPLPPDLKAGKRGGGENGSVDLNSDELALAKAADMTPEEYAKYK